MYCTRHEEEGRRTIYHATWSIFPGIVWDTPPDGPVLPSEGKPRLSVHFSWRQTGHGGLGHSPSPPTSLIHTAQLYDGTGCQVVRIEGVYLSTFAIVRFHSYCACSGGGKATAQSYDSQGFNHWKPRKLRKRLVSRNKGRWPTARLDLADYVSLYFFGAGTWSC